MLHLVSNWAEDFMRGNPANDISVTGGGSGTGIAALLNGTADICMASRKMKDKERELASKQGDELQEFTVARDGIAIIVNPKNPVNELTLDQLGEIYTGGTTNWSAFGGPDALISLLSRDSSSGTYVFFQEHVLDKRDYAATARLIPATSGIVQAVSTDEWSIGYVGLGYAAKAASKVKIIAVKQDADSRAVLPSEATVQSGDYVISRPLLIYTKGSSKPSINAFLDFCTSPEGQAIVKSTGYVPIESTAR
ncbi:MAG: phosphate ABC transporter substrate-binding protein PstS family protein, partial [Nitrospiraceae bacterium]|nr:phosphate ABC transporter substrate-binding protein PstS family protein [Nitrospiraceae bacterium]